jgi:hypothetical protein
MHSAVVKLFCVAFALYCVSLYTKAYEPELYAQFLSYIGSTSEVPTLTGDLPEPQEETPGAVSTDVTPVSPGALPPISWLTTEGVYDESLSMPHTEVSLKIGCPEGMSPCTPRIVKAGTFAGSCNVIEHMQSENQLTGILCWFGGGGDEIGVFEENGAFVLKRGEVGESTPGAPAFRGNFTTITAL